MAGRWFRFYADAIRNPKVAKLSDAQFRLWVELLAIAAENDGHIPPLNDLRYVLKRRLDHLSRGVKGLLSALLIDPLDGGYTPHNWDKFQYKTDTSTERVRKFREKRNVSETPPDTEADTELPLPNGNGRAAPDSDKVFWDDAKAYLSGHGIKNPGALIGKWSRDFKQKPTAEAITAAQIERAVEPVAYIEKTLRRGKQTEGGMSMPC